MSKLKSFMNKPMTWGDYLKLNGITLIAAYAVLGGCMIYEKIEEKRHQARLEEFYAKANLDEEDIGL